MPTKSLTLLLSLVALLIAFSGADALAVTVDFTDMNRGPSSTLYVNGVTISTANFGGDVVSMPATTAGVGLGSATVGSPGTLDRIQGAMGFARESLSLMVFGNINSITINPYFSIVGSNEVIFLPFDISFATGIATPGYQTVSGGGPITINLFGSSTLDIGLQSDFGNIAVILYLHDHPGATVQFGFAITSLDYTPAVPESGSTVILFGIGLAGIALLRRKVVAKAT